MSSDIEVTIHISADHVAVLRKEESYLQQLCLGQRFDKFPVAWTAKLVLDALPTPIKEGGWIRYKNSDYDNNHIRIVRHIEGEEVCYFNKVWGVLSICKLDQVVRVP